MHKSVLIVDDDFDIRTSVASFLDDMGYKSNTAGHGLEALNHLRSCSERDLPCFILLDLQMPVMDGEVFLKHLEQEPDIIKKVPVVIFSARGSIPETEYLKIARSKIKKPIDIDELLKIVSSFCDHN